MQHAGSLVWVLIKQPRKGGPRATPEKRPVGDLVGGDRGEVLAEHKLGPDEFALALEILEQRYPAPKIET